MKSIDVALPEDLCDWMSNTELLAAVLGEVTDTRLPLDSTKNTVIERTGSFRTWMTLTAYCYCRGFDSTEKIERAFENDSMVRYLLLNSECVDPLMDCTQ